MRDVHGRYNTTKDIADFAPAWARGCESCTNGIALAPELTGAVALYLERLVQAIDGDITFCTCQAGQRYRVSLLNRRQEIIEQARQDLKITAKLKVDNPIDIARAAIRDAQAKRVPTVHAAREKPEPVAVPA